MNTWPGGTRHAMCPEEHECWNASHYPGTRQLCCECEEPTGRCEEDSLFVETESSESVGPLCKTCYDEMKGEE